MEERSAYHAGESTIDPLLIPVQTPVVLQECNSKLPAVLPQKLAVLFFAKIEESISREPATVAAFYP